MKLLLKQKLKEIEKRNKEDIKEFIKEIKALLDDDVDQRELYLSKQIDKLAGEELK